MSQPEPEVKSRQRSLGLRNLVRLIPYARPYRWHFLGVVLLVVLFNSTAVLQPYLVKVAIDTDIAEKSSAGLRLIALEYVGVVLLGAVANYAQLFILQYASQHVIQRIREDLFSHIVHQSMSFFDRNALGRLVTNVSSDTETVNQFFTQFFFSMVRDGLSLVMVVVAMFNLDWSIALGCMVILPIIFLISQLFRKRMRRTFQEVRTRLSNVIAFLAENLAGIRITQIFQQEARQKAEFDALNNRHRRANVASYGTSVMFNRTLDLLGNLAVAGIVWVGGRAVLHNVILFGTLYAFITYVRQFFQPINSITQQWNNLQSSAVAADRISTVLQVTPDVPDEPDAVPIPDPSEVAGRVEFSHVWFHYNPGEPVLRDVTFTVEPGSFVGFVGPTGAGKSSVMSLLARFYDAIQGEVRLDGQSVSRYRQDDLHRVIGLVQQDVHLFSGTVTDNIRLFRKDISDEVVIRAAETVGADEVISRLSRGYDTQLYAKGANLSMGERQLISFARIVALDPKVLILDEATANLDSQTELMVQRGLQAVSRNRTTLVIAHRLSTIRHAHRIFVLQSGRIVEQGRHDELINDGGLYADLYMKSGIEFVANE